ncbi:MAG: hypothetical protein RL077_4729, partial [Verrucomicrobiota bacterium]
PTKLKELAAPHPHLSALHEIYGEANLLVLLPESRSFTEV